MRVGAAGFGVVLALGIGLAGCSEEVPSSGDVIDPASYASGWHTTEELVSDPAVRARVAAFVAVSITLTIRDDGTQVIGPVFEGTAVGYGAEASKERKAFHALAAIMSPADARALLRHENAALRVFVARYLMRTMGAESSELVAPLRTDTTPIGTIDGCKGGSATVASLVAGGPPYGIDSDLR